MLELREHKAQVAPADPLARDDLVNCMLPIQVGKEAEEPPGIPRMFAIEHCCNPLVLHTSGAAWLDDERGARRASRDQLAGIPVIDREVQACCR